MTPSRWSNPATPPPPKADLAEPRSKGLLLRPEFRLEQITLERRALILHRTEQAEIRLIAQVNHLLGLLLVIVLLFLGLVGVTNGFQSRWATASAGTRLAFGVGCSLAGLFLLFAMTINVGSVWFWGKSPVSTISPSDLQIIPQVTLMRATLSRLGRLEQRIARLEMAFRAASLALLVAVFLTLLAWAIASL